MHWAGIPRFPLRIVIGAFALVQMIVHFRCFLHIPFSQKREDLQLILFSTLLSIILVGGTVWIMGSLARRMAMPNATESAQYSNGPFALAAGFTPLSGARRSVAGRFARTS